MTITCSGWDLTSGRQSLALSKMTTRIRMRRKVVIVLQDLLNSWISQYILTIRNCNRWITAWRVRSKMSWNWITASNVYQNYPLSLDPLIRKEITPVEPFMYSKNQTKRIKTSSPKANIPQAMLSVGTATMTNQTASQLVSLVTRKSIIVKAVVQSLSAPSHPMKVISRIVAQW